MSNKATVKQVVSVLKEFDLLNSWGFSDVGASRLFTRVYAVRHRYNATAGEWYQYADGVWTIDRQGLSARQDAKLLYSALRKYYGEVESDTEDDDPKMTMLNKWIGRWSTASYRNTVVSDARDNNYFTNDDLDADDYLLNVKNGVLRLSPDGIEFTDHSPDLLLSKMCNVTYTPTAVCPRWDKFMAEVMEGDTERIRYLQKLFGLCLTGDIKEERMWFLYGATTRNGKSCMVETISYLMGDYAKSMKPESLAIKANTDSRQASGDIARLAGVRLVIVSEPPKRMPLDTALLKSLTGRDVIVARFLHQSEFEFIPKFKLLCNTNYLPTVADSTVFKSDRVQVIPFERHFTEAEQDKNLKGKLRRPEELSGILNWCIEGLRLYWAEGLEAPESVKAAVADYEAGSDKMGNFIRETIAGKPGHNISAKDLYDRYVPWCKDNGYYCENKGNFVSDLRGRGGFKDRGMVDGKQVRNILTDCDFIDGEFMEVSGPQAVAIPF